MLISICMFILCNVLAAIAAEAISAVLFSDAEDWRKWLARCMTFLLIVWASVIISGSFGFLRPAGILGVTSIFAALGLIAKKLSRLAPAAPAYHPRLKLTIGEYAQRLIAGSCFTLFAVGLVARLVYQPPKWFNDDFAYHATNVVQWVYDEGLTLGAFNDHAYWPLNTAVLPLWLVLPFRADGIAVWNASFWVILLTIAFIGLARAQKMDWSVGLMVSAMTVASPANAWMLGTFSAADFTGPVMLLVGITFLAPQVSHGQATLLQAQDRSSATTNVIFAGLAVGFAVGGKVPLMIAAFVIGSWILFEKSITHVERMKRGLLFAFGVAITGSYWYVRNWILTGNPLFPGKVGPFDGPLTLENAQPTLFQWMMRSPPSSAWYDFPRAYVGAWSYGLALLALVALGFAIWQCVNSRSRSVLVPLIATFLALLLTHPFMPLSGPYPVESDHPHFVPRYITSVFLLGMALTTILLGAKAPSKWIWWTWATIACAVAWTGSTIALALLMCAATVGFGLSYRFLYAPAIAFTRRLAGRVAIVTVAAFIAASLSEHSQKTVDRYIHEGYSNVPVGKGWRELEKLPPSSRIAWFDNYNWEYYPVYGRRWQFMPVPVNPDGTTFRPVHEIWRVSASTSSSADELLNNLQRSGVEYVFVSKNRSDDWPVQYEHLERSKGATKLYDDGYSAIYKI